MAYTIIRVAKLVNIGSIVAALDHNGRSRPCPGANTTMTQYNEIITGSPDTPTNMATHRAIIDPLTRQRNSVQALEYVVACPPGTPPNSAWFATYLEQSAQWIADRHGAANVVSAVIHRDESTPHLHVIVVPVATVRRKGGHEHTILSASHYVGGRDKLRALQSDFHAQVGAKFGLERGIPRTASNRVHRPVRDWTPARAMAVEVADLAKLPREDLEVIITRQRKAAKAAAAGGGEVRYIDRIVEVPVDRIVEKVVRVPSPSPTSPPNPKNWRDAYQWFYGQACMGNPATLANFDAYLERCGVPLTGPESEKIGGEMMGIRYGSHSIAFVRKELARELNERLAPDQDEEQDIEQERSIRR